MNTSEDILESLMAMGSDDFLLFGSKYDEPAGTIPAPIPQAFPQPIPQAFPQPIPQAFPAGRTKLHCPAGCIELFSRPGHLLRHWASKHVPMVKLFRCIVEGCVVQMYRPDEIRKHVKAQHREAFISGEDRDLQCRRLIEVVVPNDRYIDPNDAMLPPGVGPVCLPTISANARPLPIPARHPQLDSQRPPLVVLGNVAPASMLAAAAPQSVEAPKAPPTLAKAPTVATVLDVPLPTTEATLLIEWNHVKHQIHVLDRRRKALEKALGKLKDREVAKVRDILRRREEELAQLRRYNPY